MQQKYHRGPVQSSQPESQRSVKRFAVQLVRGATHYVGLRFSRALVFSAR